MDFLSSLFPDPRVSEYGAEVAKLMQEYDQQFAITMAHWFLNVILGVAAIAPWVLHWAVKKKLASIEDVIASE